MAQVLSVVIPIKLYNYKHIMSEDYNVFQVCYLFTALL